MAAFPEPSGIPEFMLHHRMALALEARNVKRREMAEILDVTPDTITNYTKGKTRPNAGTLRVWALRCGVPYTWLLTGDNDPDGGVTSTKCKTSVFAARHRRILVAA